MRGRSAGNPARAAWTTAVSLVAFAALFAAGCGGGDDNGGGGNELQSVGKGEGKLSLVAWVGYVEDGSTDPKVDWVSDFEKQTGCQTSVKVAGTSDEMVQLMRTGQYDGVSASGNASARLVDGGDVDPVNTDLVSNYKDVFADLKDQPYNTFDGTHYGIPHGRGANLLVWNTDAVKPGPKSWDVILDPNKEAQYKGQISIYDDPIYIADAAVYLKAHEPDLGIQNPYELNEDQFNAAVDLLKQQHPNVGEYWTDLLKQISSYTNGDVVVGTSWQYGYFTLLADNQPVAASPASQGFVPDEGATGWSDTWMISSEAQHPNCMYLWMNHVLEPDVQAQIMQWFGEAPANTKACDPSTVVAADKQLGFAPDPGFCKAYHAEDPGFWKRVYYWNTPVSDCSVVDQKAHSDLAGSGDDCKDYNDWLQAWTEIKG
jgi:putative spermidine/putrescine transport system substrate-binding protein